MGIRSSERIPRTVYAAMIGRSGRYFASLYLTATRVPELDAKQPVGQRGVFAHDVVLPVQALLSEVCFRPIFRHLRHLAERRGMEHDSLAARADEAERQIVVDDDALDDLGDLGEHG